MAFLIVNIIKRENETYRIIAHDTLDQIGVTETNQPIYRQYFAIHDPKDSSEIVKNKFEHEISLEKKRKTDNEIIETAIKLTIESIDVSKINTVE